MGPLGKCGGLQENLAQVELIDSKVKFTGACCGAKINIWSFLYTISTYEYIIHQHNRKIKHRDHRHVKLVSLS